MEQVTNFFFNQGILGVIIIVMGGVIIWCQKRLDRKDEEIKLLNQAVNVLQEKRISDSSLQINAFVGLGKDLVNSDASIQKSVDNIMRVLELKK